MNGIVCEAIYPRVSRYLGVYMELARSYQRKRG
jgi:hypothetical protein